MTDALNPPPPKPKMAKKRIVVDFPDYHTKEVFTPKWHNYAYMLGVSYKDVPVGYGENQNQKVRYEVRLEGPKDKIEELLEFIDNSLELVPDADTWPEVY